MKKRLKPLIPPDKKRCQAMKREGSFMTLGPRPPAERCTNVPTVIAKENKHNEDGRRGSMSLCDECLKELVRRTGKNYATATPIKAKGHRSMNKKCISPFLYEVEYLDTRRNKRVTCVAIHTAEHARMTAIDLKEDRRKGGPNATDISIRKYKLEKVTRL